MNNLGWYQLLTTMAKKVGGPKRLVGMFVGGGALIGGGVVAGGNALKKKITAEIEKKRKSAAASVIYKVKVEGRSNEGLLFKVGDEFCVLETDGDAALIDKTGDKNGPYFVSIKFLTTISDYKLNP